MYDSDAAVLLFTIYVRVDNKKTLPIYKKPFKYYAFPKVTFQIKMHDDFNFYTNLFSPSISLPFTKNYITDMVFFIKSSVL